MSLLRFSQMLHKAGEINCSRNGEKMLYCECENPVMDIAHDSGCRRCGKPVDFSPKYPEMTFPFAPLEKYAFPGGYEIFAVMTDGEILCANCVNDPSNPITSNMCDFPEWSDPDWNIEGIGTSEGFELDQFEVCAQCGNAIGA